MSFGWAVIWENFVNAGRLAFGRAVGLPDLFGLFLIAIVLFAERNMGVAPEVMLFSVFVMVPVLVLADLLAGIFLWLDIIIFAFLAAIGLLRLLS